jgi:hypothetical protein
VKTIALTVLCVVVAALSAGAATADEIIRQQIYETPPADTTQIKRALQFRPPPLALPDIKGRMWKLDRAEREWLTPQLKKSKQVVAFFEKPENRWLTAPLKKKCWEVPWQRTCTAARAKLRLHHALAEIAEWRLEHELPLINDWLTAVRYVQKIYPGTERELRRLSDREGGWGRWIWYSGACSSSPCLWRGYHVGGDNVTGDDTVGGWMQFRYSTFAPYWRHTLADLKKRGYEVPRIPMPPAGGDPQYAAWLSPLGQALTAGYMHWSGRAGCHWCL